MNTNSARIVTYQVQSCRECHFCNKHISERNHHCSLTFESLRDISQIGNKCPLEEVSWEESDFYCSKEDYEADQYDDMRREMVYD